METSIWVEIAKVAAGVLVGSGGLWAWVKAREDKRKTPYDMLMELLAEQKKYIQEMQEERNREKLDSAEKSAVLMVTHKCKHRFKDLETPCPVDEANEDRLKKRCERCKYNDEENADS